MTLPEKHKLGKLIQKLPPKNLDRVVEMIQPSNATDTNSSDEIHMDLERQVTRCTNDLICELIRTKSTSFLKLYLLLAE